MTDTFTVGSGRAISLPMLGTVSLSGVLRSELEPHMRDEVKKYLRQPVVHAHSLMPITIVGEVGRPGFFTVPNEVPIATALMSAGGPTREANLSNIEIERDGRPIWSGRELQQAISDGKTLEQLNLRPGDRLVVGRTRSANVESLLRMVTLLITIPSAVYAISHL